MHNSTAIALMYLMFGQFLILSFGVFVLWLMGDFGGERFNTGDRGVPMAKPAIVKGPEADMPANDNGDRLISLPHDHSIQPQVAEDPIPLGERADSDEKALSRSVSL